MLGAVNCRLKPKETKDSSQRLLQMDLVTFSPAINKDHWLGPEKITYKIHEIEPDVLFLSLIRAQTQEKTHRRIILFFSVER